MAGKDIYMLASRVDGDESLMMITQGGKMGPICFLTLQEGKDMFKEAYTVLSKLPPPDVIAYRGHFEQIAALYPVIVKLRQEDAIKTIESWRAETSLYDCDMECLSQPVLCLHMKPGFIDKFKALDIFRDIESITSVSPNGQINVQHFVISHGDSSRKPLTEKDADDILRSRGFL